MNDPRRSSAPLTSGPAASDVRAGSNAASPPGPITRVRRLWLALTAAVVAALCLPWLLAAGIAGGGITLALGPVAGLLVLGAAWLGFERLVAPELRALERARSELDARHVAGLRAAGETSAYLRDVSQEIRSTMHAVLGQTQLLSRSPLDATQHRQMRTIDGAARVLLRIINDLMALSRSGRRGFDVVAIGGSLHDVLRVSADLLATAAKNRGLELELRVAYDLPDRVLIDAGRVEQLLLGACRHAIEASAQGTLRIDARPLDMTDSRFVLSLRVERVERVEAEPSGLAPPGAAAAAPALRPSQRGMTPLLLDLAGALGGSLEAGDAGCIELRLPVQRIDNESPRLRPPPEAAARAVIRLPAASAPLLVVDSDDASRLATVELLENLGFDVEAVAGAPRAIERAAQAKFALILLDTELVGLDGYLAAARILTQLGHARPPIIGLCRQSLAEARERAAAAGMDALLAKPIERDALCAALAEWLPDEANPASSGLRLSQAGALAEATQRADVAKRSTPPADAALASQPSALRSPAAIQLFLRDVPGHYRSLASAAARDGRDDVARVATALAERCAACGATELVALCRTLAGARELSAEQLDTALDALGRALDATLRQLAALLEPPESAPASRTDGP